MNVDKWGYQRSLTEVLERVDTLRGVRVIQSTGGVLWQVAGRC